MTMEVLFAGVRVRNLAAAIDWYGRLFDRPADVVPNEHEAMWRVANGGWLFIVEDAERAGKCLVTIAVDDLDTLVAELASRELKMGPIEAVGTAGRKAKTKDPDGNSVELIEVAR
jgi:glyoxylase I family protein